MLLPEVDYFDYNRTHPYHIGGSLGIPVVNSRIWVSERAQARSLTQIRGPSTANPNEPYRFIGIPKEPSYR